LIYLYPANKMENLLLLLNKIRQLSPLGVFNQEVIVVQNAGMQHWLNISIAKECNISMNTRYALPAQFLWKLIRTLSDDKAMPEKSLYSKEVLTWRIYQLLASKNVICEPDFHQVTVYWSSNDNANNANLKRYQLSGQIADLYEQYLVFRPEWLDAWQRGDFTASKFKSKSNEIDNTDENLSSLMLEKWQGKLWQLLNVQHTYNPIVLLNSAIENMPKRQHLLPKRISFFGINAMPPMWLNFINALSEHIDVHFFHLNPCFSYWGDILTQKQATKKIAHWVDGYDDPKSFVGNPLLANFGQQGREFLALLQDYSTVNIDVFEESTVQRDSETTYNVDEQSTNLSVLSQLQNDILMLKDAREAPCTLKDDSIVITSSHSALREVQGLHDYLLHQFNSVENNSESSSENNSESSSENKQSRLTPKDILVMCPQIEQYAPYVNAVFAQGWQDIGDGVPPLPCSIADRSAKDSDVIIAAFIELLTLPDSRFHVSQLLGFLRLPVMAQRFDINQDDLRKITVWLEKASIHWGVDLLHKQQSIPSNISLNNANPSKDELHSSINNAFTWQQGLSRLLRGFAFSDTPTIYQEQLLLGDIEGDDVILLGKLLLIIEQLQQFSTQLSISRTAEQWKTLLLKQLEYLFVRKQVVTSDGESEQDSEASIIIIEQAISALVEYCHHANFNEKIELAIIKDFLDQHFSQPDPGRQFMIGQVTFCSMLPMRSIPFKIIAVLGLNDGDFPRQRQSLGFDLMSLSQAKLGDRSRRGDDRYLFLEALISARQSLYLSFQGRNIKNNTQLQPSLVLKELMEYLQLGYGWNFSPENTDDDIRQLPMQAFSEQNYRGKWASFDANWLKLGQEKSISSPRLNKLVINNENANVDGSFFESNSLSSNELIRFYQHPAKYFAQNQLNLYFEDSSTVLSDHEPFSTNTLEVYLLREQLLKQFLSEHSTNNNNEKENEEQIEQVIRKAELSGKFPDFPTIEPFFEKWQSESKGFSQYIQEKGGDNPVIINGQLSLILKTAPYKVNVTVDFPVKTILSESSLFFYRSSGVKPKDLFTLYLHQLMIQVWQNQQISEGNQDAIENKPLMNVTSTQGLFFNTKDQKATHYKFSDIENAKSILETIITTYFLGQTQALLLNGSLADDVLKLKRGKPKEMNQLSFMKLWQGSNQSSSNSFNQTSMVLGDDPYIQYFWPECPEWDEHKKPLHDIYQGLYQSMQTLKPVELTVNLTNSKDKGSVKRES